MQDISSSDFFRDPALLVEPHAFYDAVRQQCPVWREGHHDVVLVTGYEEAIDVFNDAETFSSCLAVTGPFPGFPVPLEGDDVSALIEEHRHELPMSDQLPNLDPPVHTAHRGLLMSLITPKRLKENEAQMWQLADQLLDSLVADGGGEFIGDFASPFTRLVIADLLGVPDEDLDELAREMQHHPDDAGVGSIAEDDGMAHSPLEYLYLRFSNYIQSRRDEPRADVLTSLAEATFPDGTTPDVGDVARVAVNLFAAGQETTVRLLGAALRVLAERPDLQQALRNDRSLIPSFIEETLRLESPIKGDFRLSRVPTTVAGVDLPAGTTVMVLNGAANRDPRFFEDPGTFDIARPNARRHIAFGRGIHTCPGAPLARAEGRVALERLLDRTTDIRISDAHHGPEGGRDFGYLPSFILRGLAALHLELRTAVA
ncbi:MAG: cytochrome P450 [Mycobacteriales bacterium]